MRLAIFSGLLFLSGVSALIFETLWLRLSGLAFGNSVWSVALILSSFMTGLALGNAIAASLKLRGSRPLVLYALLEIGVAVFGCIIVFGLPLLGQWMRPVFQILWNNDGALNGVRFLVSFLILLIPTTAMGLTLPVLLDDSVLRRHDFVRAVGVLYGANTLGAVAGALLGEVFLIGAFGLLSTSLAAGVLNCAAAGIALLVVKTGEATTESASPSRLKINHSLPWRLLFVSLGTGVIFLCLEVVWFRFLRLYIASSSTAFSVMLAVVLAGIGVGGLAAGLIHRHFARVKQLLPILLFAAAIATLLSYLFFPGGALQRSAHAFYLDSWREISLLSLALMFPVAFLSGILFPSIAARVQVRVESRMNSTGIVTLFNTSGAAAGPLLASFILLPGVGFQWTLAICALGYLFLAFLVTERQTDLAKRPLAVLLFGLCAVVALIIAVFASHQEDAHLANARRLFEMDGEHLIKKVEGTSDTLQLLRRDLLGEPYYYRLMTNGFSMSATHPRSQRYMRLFAYLPLALRPESQDALLICYGLGATADALIRNSQLKRVDMVDISKEVFQLAAYDSNPNRSNPLADSRATTFVQDGRFFLQASPRQYDVITGEPPPPKVAGAVNLYTAEFFSLMKDRLKDGGVATFWLPIYQLKVDEVKAILLAFRTSFPNASVWGSWDEEWIMTGIKGSARKLDEQEIRRLWVNEETRADLLRIGVEVPEQLAALFLMDGDEIDRITNGIKPLTDFFPKRLSDAQADPEAIHNFALPYMKTSSAVRRFRSSSLIETIWPETVKRTIEPFFAIRETRYLSDVKGTNKLAELDLYLRGSRLRTPVLEVLGSNEFRVSIAERVASKLTVPPAEALPDLMAGALARRDFTGAIHLLEMKRTLRLAGRDDLFLLIYLYCLNENVEKAEAVAAEMGSIERDSFVNWLWGKLQAEFGFRPPP